MLTPVALAAMALVSPWSAPGLGLTCPSVPGQDVATDLWVTWELRPPPEGHGGAGREGQGHGGRRGTQGSAQHALH